MTFFIKSKIGFFWSLVIYIQILFYLKKKDKKFFYFNKLGWGDNIVFFLSQYSRIKYNKGYYCLTYSQEKKNICEFFFDKKKISATKFLIPNNLSTSFVENHLVKFKKFTPIVIEDENKRNQEYFVKNKDSYKNLLKTIYKRKSSLDCSKFGSYACLYLRYNEYSQVFPSIRQSQNINKIFDIIDFLLEKKINVFLIGKSNEKYLIYVKKKYVNMIGKKIFLLNQELKNINSYADQLNIFDNSLFYCGSHAGPLVSYYFLQKQALSFDAFYREELDDEKFKNFYFIFKKIILNNKEIILSDKNLKFAQDNKYVEVKECSSKMIIQCLNNSFLD
tara:strand:- start:786 stop:1784 length:999 start_codon:yes stop_codon:yes gene_type:complete